MPTGKPEAAKEHKESGEMVKTPFGTQWTSIEKQTNTLEISEPGKRGPDKDAPRGMHGGDQGEGANGCINQTTETLMLQ